MPTKLTSQDFADAAALLGCSVAAIKAVASVESAGGGFLPDGRPKILFERHHFSKLTGHEHDADHPGISSAKPGGYLGGAREWRRFAEAAELDETAAIKSASWGKFQIMGFNFSSCGCKTIYQFRDLMTSYGERGHLAAFCLFIQSNKLATALKGRDWAEFARRYNGPAYKKNQYDTKMATAYAKFAAEETDLSGAKALNVAEILAAVPASNSKILSTNLPETASTDQPTVTQQPNVEVVNAPAKENSTATAAKITIGGFALPTVLVVVVQAIQDLIANGFVDARSIGDLVLGFVKENTKYFFGLIALIILGLMFKKLWKQITLWLQIWLAGKPDANTVEVKQQ